MSGICYKLKVLVLICDVVRLTVTELREYNILELGPHSLVRTIGYRSYLISKGAKSD